MNEKDINYYFRACHSITNELSSHIFPYNLDTNEGKEKIINYFRKRSGIINHCQLYSLWANIPRLQKDYYNIIIIDNNYKNIYECLSALIEKKNLNAYIEDSGQESINTTKFNINFFTLDTEKIEELKKKKYDDELLKNELETKRFPHFKNENNDISIYEADFILLDLYMDENVSGRFSGQFSFRLIEILKTIHPDTPVFIFSCIDINTIKNLCIELGAENYLAKYEAYLLPEKIVEFENKIGPLLINIREDKLRKNAIGNIRTWLQSNDLWFGDKCYHMINHSLIHCSSVWKYINQLFTEFYKNEYKNNKNNTQLDEEIYTLAMTSWLHDIGHRGDDLVNNAGDVRAIHGYMSAKLIGENPQIYDLLFIDNDNKERTYTSYKQEYDKNIEENVISTFCDSINIDKLFNNRENTDFLDKVKFKLLKNIMLLSAFHQGKTILFFDDEKKSIILDDILLRKRYVPDKEYRTLLSSKESNPVINELSCVPKIYWSKNRGIDLPFSFSDFFKGNDPEIDDYIMLAGFFRFIDGIDINNARIGYGIKNDIHIAESLKNDILSYTNHLKSELNLIITDEYQRNNINSILNNGFFDIAKNDVKKIKKTENIEFNTIFIDNLIDFLESNSLYNIKDIVKPTTEYIKFIAKQIGHINLHKAIQQIEIVTKYIKSKYELIIQFHSDKLYSYFGIVNDNKETKGKYKFLSKNRNKTESISKYKVDELISNQDLESDVKFIQDGDGKYKTERTLGEHLLLWYVWKEWELIERIKKYVGNTNKFYAFELSGIELHCKDEQLRVYKEDDTLKIEKCD